MGGKLEHSFEFKGFAQSHVLNDVPNLFFDGSLVIPYAMFPMLFSWFPLCSLPNYCSFSLQRWSEKWEKYISSLGRVQF